MTPIETIALMLGVGWASGINLYAAILVLGLLGSTGSLVLPENLEVLAHPLVMTGAGFMYCVEFFADKVPGVDSGWDLLHSFIRIPAGAVLAAAAVGDVPAGLQLAAGLVGGSVAATSHATKSGARLVINASPEPVSNWMTSLSEDVAVITGVWLSLNYPALFLAFFVLFLLSCLWVLPRIWRLLKRGTGQIWNLFRRLPSSPST